ncbi:hypothetical protein Agub_g12471 [Astrephomene gubernaculifera]|uniref:Macro domain-containing protein n=1 Tax=Astrephomene gubernaculifera TaxID=47775 RepID=A0AAD3HRC0_9CHLO|nr:hypothetical protein Agub_g12468 [Astrephomene gubernaculifera]GFR50283.1 hypothetical protein Agub_g12471 [Astrephomene gubernaculifera]
MTNNTPPAVGRREYLLASGTRLIVFQGSMPDWPKMQLDRPDADRIRPIAVVNAANQRLCGGGGVDGMIHKKAGPELLQECQSLPEIRPGIRCPTGEAVVTGGYKFGTDYIIHTCGPVYATDKRAECEGYLTNAYRHSLQAATKLGTKVVAFAAISTGVYAYPIREATKTSFTVLKDAKPPVQEVWVVMFMQSDFDTAVAVAQELNLQEYVPGQMPLPLPSPPQQQQQQQETQPAQSQLQLPQQPQVPQQQQPQQQQQQQHKSPQELPWNAAMSGLLSNNSLLHVQLPPTQPS